MKKFKVKIKNADKAKIIKADNELEARIRFCQDNDLLYRVYANKIDIKKLS